MDKARLDAGMVRVTWKPPIPQENGSPIRILVVNEDAVEATLVATILGCTSPTRFTTAWAGNAAEAMARLESEPFDICLLDYWFDGLTAIDFMDEMGERAVDVPVIVLSGDEDRSADLEVERRGAYDFVLKQELSGPAMERTIRYALARRRLEADLARSALYDDLTGLPNRRQFLLHLERAAERAIRQDASVCIAFLDLDGFKAVNDRYGHDAGDEVLRRTASRIECCVRREDVAARLAGDEFAVILEGSRDRAVVDQIIARLRERLCEPMEVGERTVAVGVSIGLAWFPAEASSIFEAVRLADHAMYRAKGARGRRGRDAVARAGGA